MHAMAASWAARTAAGAKGKKRAKNGQLQLALPGSGRVGCRRKKQGCLSFPHATTPQPAGEPVGSAPRGNARADQGADRIMGFPVARIASRSYRAWKQEDRRTANRF